MTSLWIVDRDPRRRAALARLAGAPDDSVQGAPGDPLFEAVQAAPAIVMGLAGDFEPELQFAHRTAARLPETRWVLLPERDDVDRARRLFDTLDASLLAWPPEARSLRRLLRRGGSGAGEPLPLSRRPARDALGDRFARWFADLELPELLRALDPRFADVPLLVTGEPGTGRGLFARYVHAFGGGAGGELLQVVCGEATAAGEIAAALTRREGGRRPGLAVWLEDVDRLPEATQRQLASWIEYGPPASAVPAGQLRWLGTGVEPPQPELQRALGRLSVHLPPLRERTVAIANFANASARAWCNQRRERARRFGEDAVLALEAYPWPGNLGELEGVVIETLLSTSANPIPADELQYEGAPFAPLEAAEVGALLLDESDELAPPADSAPPPPAAREPAPPARPEAASATAPAAPDASLRRVVGALAHEVRNPLSSIRTFADLLPTRYGEAEFRERFAEVVRDDVRRIEDVVERLRQLATLAPPERERVDVGSLLEGLLEERRVTVHERRLVVLKELEPGRCFAQGDAEQLRFAFEALVSKSLQLVPEGGSLYFAARAHPEGLRGAPSVRVLVRFHGPERGRGTAPAVPGLSIAEHSLEFALAEAIVRAHQGTMAIDPGDAGETVILLDLPAPALAAPLGRRDTG